MDEAEIDACRNRDDGTPLRAALQRAGLAGRPRATLDPARYRGYLEAHIEQGEELDSSGKQLGVVTSIVGARGFRITFEGVQNHAGTTRMAIRRDAGVALVRLASAIDQRFPARRRAAHGLDHRAHHAGAGRAEHRSRPAPRCCSSSATRTRRCSTGWTQELEVLVAEAGQGPVQGHADATCHARCRRRWTPASRTCWSVPRNATRRALSSQCQVAPVTMRRSWPTRLPAAMLFVPSIGGISHHWTEDTSEADIVLGCAVLADAAEAILGVR